MSLPAAPTLDTAVQAMLDALKPYLPASGGALPDHTVSVTSLSERSAGLGNLRGAEVRGAFPAVDLKGIRVDAVTRFQLWAKAPAAADGVISTLTARLAGDADTLWGNGFLKLALESAPPPELVQPLDAWRKHADYRVLFEYRYSDTGGADSLIAKIPIEIDSVFDEKTIVTDELARWDDVEAPALVVRGPMTVGALSVLLFVAGAAPTGKVTLTRTFDDAVGLPATHTALANFLADAAGPAPAQRNASLVYATFNDFRSALTGGVDIPFTPFSMGDHNTIPDVYTPLQMALGAGIVLSQPSDRFEVTYDSSALDTTAVMYVRATRAE